MKKVAAVIDLWSSDLCDRIDVEDLRSRNPIAHKWKALYRSICLREAIFWRITDLLKQITVLAEAGHLLGARILLRSTVETLGILIYLNQKTIAVLEGNETLHSFSDKTSQLLLGSKNNATEIEAINILTILKKFEKKYPGILEIYSDLCESAHPNYDGVCHGYSFLKYNRDETIFKNRWNELYGSDIEDQALEFMKVFEEEYIEVWPKLFDRLEKWIEENDERLEAEKTDK